MEVSSNLQIIVTHSPVILKKDIKKKIHVWYVKHDKWIELDTPVVGDDVTADEARYKFTTHIRNLKYPTIVSMKNIIHSSYSLMFYFLVHLYWR